MMTATVLVIDAVPLHCAVWQTLLTGQGYDVIAARSGEAALALCADLQPDLVLLNDPLPDIQSLELCRRLKGDPRNCLTPVIFLAAPGNTSDPSGAFESGADDFWRQSPSPGELLDRVRCLLQLKTYIDEQTQSVIFSLAQSVDARDSYGGGHGERVSNHAVRLGKSLGLGPRELDTLRIAGLVHDVGKVGVPDSVLFKPGPLNPDEIRIVEQHPILGEKICAPLKSLRRVLPIIRHHHEHLNGSGYPDGLQGDYIPLTARILQIADICDALTTDRPYRKGLSMPSALIILYEEADRGWLDQALVSQFASLVVGADSSLAPGNRGRNRSMEAAKSMGGNSGRLSTY